VYLCKPFGFLFLSFGLFGFVNMWGCGSVEPGVPVVSDDVQDVQVGQDLQSGPDITASQYSSNDPCVSCTTDEAGLETCTPKVAGSGCDDGNCCTSGATCELCTGDDCPESGLTCSGQQTACDDQDPCTDDLCTCGAGEPTCLHPPSTNGTPCVYDENACNEGDSCMNGWCEPGIAVDLDDGNPCTVDVCVKGEVVHEPMTQGQCDDGDECTTDDHCYLGTCTGGPLVVCQDKSCASSVSCVTGQGCVPVWLPEGAACDDGNSCTFGDACNADHVCAGDPLNACNDQNPCTQDSCDAEGNCIHENIESECNDGNPCTMNDVCEEGICQGEAMDCSVLDSQCTAGACQNGGCVAMNLPGECEDGDLCTSSDQCHNGMCVSGVALDCSELDGACSEGVCTNGVCVQNLLSGTCDDGDPLTCNDNCGSGECVGGSCEQITGETCDDPIDMGSGGILEVNTCDFQKDYSYNWCGIQGPEVVFTLKAGYANGGLDMVVLQSIPNLVINYRFYIYDWCVSSEWYQINGFCSINSAPFIGWGGYDPNADLYFAIGSESGDCGVVRISAYTYGN